MYPAGYRSIGNHTLDVVLAKTNRGREESRRCPDDCDQRQGIGRNSVIGDRRATMKTPAVTMVAA